VTSQPDPQWTSPSLTRSARNWRREVLVCLAVAVAVAAFGGPLGLLWRAVAPKVELIQGQGGPYPVDAEPEGYIADEGWFVGLAFVTGAVVAIGVWLLLRRYRGPMMLAAITIGSVGGAVFAAWLGHQIGLAEFQRLVRDAQPGTRMFRPVNLRISDVGLWFGVIPRVRGVVLVQAIVAAALYTAVAGFHRSPDLEGDGEPAAIEPGGEPDSGAHPQPASWGWTAPQDQSAVPGPPVPYATTPPPDATARARHAAD
jgi:Protein of unknown function (DUF2567)